MSSRGLALIISGPSGVGKTTIAREIEQRLDGIFSVSMATRPKTSDDVDGVDYCFVDHDRFEQLRDQGALLEWAHVFGNDYGTPRQPVVDALVAEKLIILEIDVQGAIQVKQRLPESYALFVRPPDASTLLKRLRDRKREDETLIQRRFAKANAEIAKADACGIYDAFVINDDLAWAIDRAIGLIQARRQEGVCGGS